jgi:hypothetical protein
VFGWCGSSAAECEGEEQRLAKPKGWSEIQVTINHMRRAQAQPCLGLPLTLLIGPSR